jgi:hypothetical protein
MQTFIGVSGAGYRRFWAIIRDGEFGAMQSPHFVTGII